MTYSDWEKRPPRPRRVAQQPGNAPSLTKQSFLKDCDINLIMARFASSGILPTGTRLPLDNAPRPDDYQQAMNLITGAESSFLNLPAKIRRRFKDDPQALLAFVSDEKNRQEAEDLGIIQKRAPEVTQSVPPAPPAAPVVPPAPAPAPSPNKA